MNNNVIRVKGARVHNLKNIDVEIPKDKLVVITGLSGSGKSSLAFDTIYAEGQRKYVESLSAYARQFLGLMDKADVDSIEGLSPAISIDQKTSGHNPRSTVGTITEIYDYLRLTFARAGHPHSPITRQRLESQTVQQIVDRILELPHARNQDRIKTMLLAPIVKNRKGTYEELFQRLLSQGYVRVRVDGEVFSLEEDIKMDRYKKHTIEVIVDRLILTKESKADPEFSKRLTDSIELTLNLGDKELYVNLLDSNEDLFFSEKLVDPQTGESFPEVEPHTFSFNSPFGACEICNGLGFIKEIEPSTIYNPKLTISEGGIFPWSKMADNPSSWYMRVLDAVAKDQGFSTRTALGKLTEDQINIILYGTGNKKYMVEYESSTGGHRTVETKFEGVIPSLNRRYQQTESDYIRREIEEFMRENPCNECNGKRLNKVALSVTIEGQNIDDVTNTPIGSLSNWIDLLKPENSSTHKDKLTNQEKEIVKQVVKELESRVNFLKAVGLDYLTLSRTARTLSGGESQRIRLASQIGTGLTGVLYVLDEPSIGLHQRDNQRLIDTLKDLKQLGNSILIVEHDSDTMLQSDQIIDIGPGAGEHGGRIVAQGTPEEVMANPDSVTGAFLSGRQVISTANIQADVKEFFANHDGVSRKHEKVNKGKFLTIKNAQGNNLKDVSVDIPLGKFVCITGVSGSGKSTLINETLVKVLRKHFYKSKEIPAEHKAILGLEHLDKIINIDQSPIGRTPRSNPATYTGLFTPIRDIFAATKEAKARGYKAGRFSFNVRGGRCEACQGDGLLKIEMQFLPDVYVECEQCKGQRYNRETLQIDFKGYNISEILNLSVEDALQVFENVPAIANKLTTLNEVGLSYIKLGQSATTLSGGEAQRIKLATELSKRSTGKTLYVLDEPTTGLHFEDLRKLLVVLHSLVAQGNSVVTIEHNLDFIKTADWVIDLGPEGGEKGGKIIAEGRPEQIAGVRESYTGEWLKKIIQ